MEKQNGIPMQLKQVTDIRDGVRKETVVLEAKGIYYIKENAMYLHFEEQQEIGSIRTVVKITNDEVLVMRSGAVHMRHAFRKTEETTGHYRTSFGQWTMKTKTDQIEFHYDDKRKKGRLFVSYQLQMQNEQTGRHAMTIMFKGV
ncbi:DUF1934 domain-containing protein [Saccharococcus thermophilus]|uniref:Uncharacterized beta-barrel protein YwiB (DUF1934 family) n=1 Tax=Saccharococcus thermophilus TaxID=29396 RepID=A0A846MBH4_9BACL|nr:DUF1934 domain-containing protein [Saccharococcus thermophilus]NIK13807.1 uncharacterized beta-barrel protein YwiB (DUF1934 family) [Saccharococcus thermophilus]